MKLYLSPHPTQTPNTNGVGRVVHAQYQYLPKLGAQFVGHPDKADIVASHITYDGQFDVLHNHGLYWTGDMGGMYSEIHQDANTHILKAIRRARAITVPSRWVALPFQRDMHLTPTIIGHGIEPDAWTPGKNGGYVLWNKNRIGDVCDPTPALELAKVTPTVITLMPRGANPPQKLMVTGLLTHDEMKQWVRNADIYLATTQETFGIGTLEAMAAGVPILGYKWGATPDLVQHGVNGYLVEPGDIKGLADGVGWIREHRKALSEAAIETAKGHSWYAVMQQYMALYESLLAPDPQTVAVVITNYNYGRFLEQAVRSVTSQTYPVDELVIVDDGSNDGSSGVLDAIEEHYPEVRVIRQPNQGVASARNHGVAYTQSTYVVCLDADDQLAPDYVAVCRDALMHDRELGIAFTGLGWLDENRIGPNVWGTDFDWEKQATRTVPPSTTIPTAAMFRRSLWNRGGGYVQRYAPGEDTEFYTHGLALGFSAKRVSDRPLIGYRNTPNSASKRLKYKPLDDRHPWLKDKHYPMAAPSVTAPKVRHYDQPLVTIIVPVGPGHVRYLPEALDSLEGQTFRNWEVVVVDDTGGTEGIAELLTRVYPYARYYTCERKGAGAARNIGITQARAPFLFFLDADDLIAPHTLMAMLRTFASGEAGYVYSDWKVITPDGIERADRAEEYDQKAWFYNGHHAISVLIPTVDARGVRGFDEAMPGWEDWDFFLKLAVSGVCGKRLPEPLLTYRQGTGNRRERSLAQKNDLFDYLKQRYEPFTSGAKTMGSCCGGNGGGVLAAKAAILGERVTTREEQIAAPTPEGMVRLQYIGDRKGPVTYMSNGRGYQFADDDNYRFVDVRAEDVERLLSTGVIRRARVLAPVEPEPAIQEPTSPEPTPVELTPDEAGTLVQQATAPTPQELPVEEAPTAVQQEAAAASLLQQSTTGLVEAVLEAHHVKPRKRKVTAASKKEAT